MISQRRVAWAKIRSSSNVLPYLKNHLHYLRHPLILKSLLSCQQRSPRHYCNQISRRAVRAMSGHEVTPIVKFYREIKHHISPSKDVWEFASWSHDYTSVIETILPVCSLCILCQGLHLEHSDRSLNHRFAYRRNTLPNTVIISLVMRPSIFLLWQFYGVFWINSMLHFDSRHFSSLKHTNHLRWQTYWM